MKLKLTLLSPEARVCWIILAGLCQTTPLFTSGRNDSRLLFPFQLPFHQRPISHFTHPLHLFNNTISLSSYIFFNLHPRLPSPTTIHTNAHHIAARDVSPTLDGPARYAQVSSRHGKAGVRDTSLYIVCNILHPLRFFPTNKIIGTLSTNTTRSATSRTRSTISSTLSTKTRTTTIATGFLLTV